MIIALIFSHLYVFGLGGTVAIYVTLSQDASTKIEPLWLTTLQCAGWFITWPLIMISAMRQANK